MARQSRKPSCELAAREIWTRSEMMGTRVTTFRGPGILVSARNECLGFTVALESGGNASFEASELMKAEE